MRRTPASCSSRTDRTTSAKAGTSASGKPAAGSSMRTNRGVVARARATPRRRSSPCASEPAAVSAYDARCNDPSSSPARRRASRGGAPTPSAATSTFSRTDRLRNERLCWKVLASPARPRRCGLQRVMSRPSSSTEPSSGKSKPVRTLTSVDLPAPFGPMSPTTSFRWSSRVTPWSAWTPSNERETSAARSSAPDRLVSSGCVSASGKV